MTASIPATSSPSCALPGLQPFLRPIGKFVIAAHLALALQPLSAIAQPKGQIASNPVAEAQMRRYQALSHKVNQARADKQRAEASPLDVPPERLERAVQLTRSLRARAGDVGTSGLTRLSANAQPDVGLQLEWSELQSTLQSLHAANTLVLAEMNTTGQLLRQKNAGAVILERHAAAERTLQERIARFEAITAPLSGTGNLTTLSEGKGSGTANALRQGNRSIGRADVQASAPALADLERFLAQNNTQRTPTPLDPKKLPWSTPPATPRMPAETAALWVQKLKAGAPTQALSKTQAAPLKLAKASATTRQNLRTQTTTIAGLQFTDPPTAEEAPTDADLAETAETTLTPAIRAKAEELDRNPVAIHNWVRNHIDYVPTWGAIQSAQDTLDKSRGNAHDIASLTIALLRASGIPARYQWGTIELPADQVMNWVGGVTKPEAALNLMYQGGIAARGFASGGTITAIRMEHVWVNAYVNYAPGRGAVAGDPASGQHVNPNASLNAWAPLDGAFKQFTFAPGMDLQTAVPLDADALLAAARQGATVNEAEGWVQNLNQAAIQNQLAAYQARLKTYIDRQPSGANTTVGDVIGKKIIPERMPAMLASTTAYQVVLQGAQAASIPDALQHKFTYRLYASDADRSDDNPLLSFTEKTSRLVGKRVTLTYAPATQADADLIASYLPKPHADGSPVQPNELPTSLPGYLIRLTPQISVDGQVVAKARDALTMGTDLYSQGGFTQLGDPTQWDLSTEESNVVGQVTAIGISAGGIGVQQLTMVKARLAATHVTLQTLGSNADSAALTSANLQGEQVAGDLLTATIWSWFAATEGHSRQISNQASMVENSGLSYGLFHASINSFRIWGVVRKVNFPGVNFDIGHVRSLTWEKTNDVKNWVVYNRLRGQYMSALEHAGLERFFNNPKNCNFSGGKVPMAGLAECPSAISAVRVIGSATIAGQKIYTITQEIFKKNPAIVSTALSAHSSAIQGKIQRSLELGQEVTTHELPLIEGGWKGSGYISIDPNTGAGAYIIEGGVNGGWYSLLSQAGGAMLIVLGLSSLLAKAGLIAALTLAPWLMLALAAITLVCIYMAGDDWDPKGCGGLNTCDSFGAIQIFSALGVMAALFGGGTMVGFTLGFFVFYQMIKGKYFY